MKGKTRSNLIHKNIPVPSAPPLPAALPRPPRGPRRSDSACGCPGPRPEGSLRRFPVPTPPWPAGGGGAFFVFPPPLRGGSPRRVAVRHGGAPRPAAPARPRFSWPRPFPGGWRPSDRFRGPVFLSGTSYVAVRPPASRSRPRTAAGVVFRDKVGRGVRAFRGGAGPRRPFCVFPSPLPSRSSDRVRVRPGRRRAAVRFRGPGRFSRFGSGGAAGAEKLIFRSSKTVKIYRQECACVSVYLRPSVEQRKIEFASRRAGPKLHQSPDQCV